MKENRRTFLRQMTASVVAPHVTPFSKSTAGQGEIISRESQKRRPNVLMMICDDLGYGDLGCYGSAIPTPNLDRLASQGMRCMRHNSAHPICSASRAALLTGRYAPRSHTPGALFPHATVAMATEEQTLANLFQDAGYRTHAIGKWHLGDEPGYRPTERGFNSYLGVPWSVDMKPLPLLRNTSTLEENTDRDELTLKYTEEALHLLNQKSDDPFFLYLAYSYPHDPARASAAFKGKSQFGDFGDSVEEIDWSVGALLDALEHSGKADQTIVLFTSDHGPWFQGSPGKLRGRKGTTFEGGLRVPFLIRWPGHVPSASVSNEPIGHLNILPTLSAWCDLAKPRLPLDGFDASPVFLKNDKAPAKPVFYFGVPGGGNDIHCVRAGAWKLRISQNDGEIYINDRGTGNKNYMLAKPELYNLELDPCESYDVAKEYPEIVRQLEKHLQRELATFPAEIQTAYSQMRGRTASITTPPGAAPRFVSGPLPDWAWEPDDRRSK